jgi:hypothetical protein
MNTFWHFGDSFSFNNFDLENEQIQIENFGHLLSKKLKMKYEFRGMTGWSNYMIFNKIILNSFNFKSGDVVFINWSFFSRNSYLDLEQNNSDINKLSLVDNHKIIKSTNHWFDKNHGQYDTDLIDYKKFVENNLFMLKYTTEYNLDFNVKLFSTVSNFFSNLIKKGISVYNLFIRDSDLLNYGNSKFKINFEDSIGNLIKFEPSYFEWLESNNFKGGKEGHYSKGIQEKICDEIYKRMEIEKIKSII